MASSLKCLDDFTLPEAYELEKGEYVEELLSFALTLRHKKTKARILVLSNEDENKVFNIGFRTPPKDCTGVPHIIEHTVLCGSKNFPAKDPFVELVKGSLNTFLNATTYPDKTMYPIASCNDKDFKNLMHVYLDAVFYPNIYKYEEIFKQEGWHYELESEDGELTYNGVVYNEMKGAFSSADGLLDRYVMNFLFPDNTYGYESGGDPKNIPDLTYEDYLDFHRTYYHPSNSYIYLYGDMDVEERLTFLDEHYLANFDELAVDSEIPLQKPFPKRKDFVKKYAVEKGANCTEKTFYAYAAAMDITLDLYTCRAFELLSYVLVEMPGAPLKQALLDAGIGSDIDVDFTDILRQSYFAVITKNAPSGLKDKFLQVYQETLQKLVTEGIDKKALEAAINGTEFREREGDFGSYPKGLMLGFKTFKTWLYDDSMPYDSLRYEDAYRFLKEQLHTDYYENLIKTYLLENPHAILIEMQPEPGLAAKEEAETKKKLQAYKESLSKDELLKIIEDTKALKQYQEEPTPKEILEMIPMLTREDIKKETTPYQNDVREIQGIKTLFHDIPTSEIIYFSIYFHINDMEDYMPQISFLTTLLGYMDTEQHSYHAFDTEVNFHTGGISADASILSKNQGRDVYDIWFEVRGKMLRSKAKEALDLMAEMMFTTLLDDEKHLREVVSEARSRLRMRLTSSGHQAAAGRAVASFSKSAWLSDHFNGLGYYEYLVYLDEHFEEQKDTIRKGYQALLANIFKKEKMLFSITGTEEEYQAMKAVIPSFLEKLQSFHERAEKESYTNRLVKLEKYTPNPDQKKEGFGTPAEIQYVAIGGSFSEEPFHYGALRVARHLLNYNYLWNEVRVKGGAYGVSCQFTREGEGFFTSYRDPKLSSTIKVYEGAADYLEHYEADERELTKTIIGTISGMDTPLTPNMKGRRSMAGYLSSITVETLQEERDEVLSCQIEDLRKLAPVIRKLVSGNHICVIGNEEHLEAEKELFDSIEPLK